MCVCIMVCSKRGMAGGLSSDSSLPQPQTEALPVHAIRSDATQQNVSDVVDLHV